MLSLPYFTLKTQNKILPPGHSALNENLPPISNAGTEGAAPGNNRVSLYNPAFTARNYPSGLKPETLVFLS
jgi:hypothetical protein